MDVSSLGSVVNAYQYASHLNRRNVAPIDFKTALNEATSATDKVEAYKNSLESKFGVPIIVSSVSGDQDSMDRFAMGTTGTGNVCIAPNILEKMANDPEKAAHYEEMIQHHFDTLPETEAFMASIGHNITSCGVVIHEDGTAHYYLSGEESEEYKAKVEADHKAKREKEAEKRKEERERIREASEDAKRRELESLQRRNIEEILYGQTSNDIHYAFDITHEGLLSAFESGLKSYDASTANSTL